MPEWQRMKTGLIVFQSAPGLEAGRCSRLRLSSAFLAGGFNPRPALRPGDAQDSSDNTPVLHEFQSAPGLEAGRCVAAVVTGETPKVVSIRARP